MIDIVIDRADPSPRSEWQGAGRQPMKGNLPRGWRLEIDQSRRRTAPRGLAWLVSMTYHSISRSTGALGVCAAVAIARPAHAEPRAVVELFTSQGCSSCPAADKVLGELARDPNVIALSLPIDYWDYLGWKDTLADSRFTARQKAYSRVRGDRDVYTPQVVVNGATHVIGSDRGRIEGAIDTTKNAEGVMSVPVSMSLSGKQINVSVAASKASGAKHGEVW